MSAVSTYKTQILKGLSSRTPTLITTERQVKLWLGYHKDLWGLRTWGNFVLIDKLSVQKVLQNSVESVWYQRLLHHRYQAEIWRVLGCDRIIGDQSSRQQTRVDVRRPTLGFWCQAPNQTHRKFCLLELRTFNARSISGQSSRNFKKVLGSVQ